jgi:CheY-like chemotaxis protein
MHYHIEITTIFILAQLLLFVLIVCVNIHNNKKKGEKTMNKNVLLIDDEAGFRRNVSFGLMQQGYYTEPCETGMKGLETLETLMERKMPLKCAIVDIRLPDIDGLKLLKVIKSNYPDLPVILITGYGNDTVAEEAKSQKVEAYLEKPFSVEELAKVIESIPAEGQKAEIEAEVLTPQPVPAQSKTAYALVTLEKGANLLSVYRALYFHGNVVYCDAIRGDYDLVLLLQAETVEGITEIVENEIKKVPGVADVTLLNVEVPIFGENVHRLINSVDKALGRDKEAGDVNVGQMARVRTSSYVVMEIEKEKLEAIYPALYFNDQVVYCDYTVGKYDIVLLMKGTSFSEIEHTIKTKFKPMDGVLRIKQWPVLTLFET